MPAQQPLHRSPLHTPTAAMNQPYLAKPGVVRSLQVVVYHRHHVTGGETVKVD